MKKSNFQSLWMFIVCFFSVILVNAQIEKSKIDEYVKQYATSSKSKFFLQVKDPAGKSAYYGYDGRNNVPIQNFDFTFEIGSCSKMFTAVAVLQLIEQNKLKLEDRLVDVLPNPELYRNLIVIDKVDYINQVKIKDLLHHSSGFADYFISPDSLELKVSGDRSLVFTPEQLIKRAKRINKPHFIPGTNKFKYSNVNYILLGMIIEKLTGMKYQHYIQKNILKPLKLKNTYFGTLEIPNNSFPGHYKGQHSEIPYSMAWSAGEIIASLEDMVTFINHWYDGDLFAKPETKAIFKKDFYNDMGMGMKYGLGNINLFDQSYGHGGQTFSFVSYMAKLPNGYSFVLGLDDASADSWSPAIWMTSNLK